jgi:hypothetical protein
MNGVGGELVLESFYEEAPVQAGPSEDEILEQAASITSRLERQISQWIQRRRPVEDRWLRDIRQYQGEYDTSVMKVLDNDDERSKIFINITRTKTKSWKARIIDMLFQQGEKNWRAKPTPVPELSNIAQQALQMAEQAAQQAQEQAEAYNQGVTAGAPPEQLDAMQAEAEQSAAAYQRMDSIQQQVRAKQDEADKRAAAMEREINDQLGESYYASRVRDVVSDACKVGVGILKGPVATMRPARKWAQGDDGGFAMNRNVDKRPEVTRVSFWNFFPDPDALSMDDCDTTFERHILSEGRFQTMAKAYEWSKTAARDILKQGPQSLESTEMHFLSELRKNDDGAMSGQTKHFVVWEYHGALLLNEISTLLTAMGNTDDAAAFMADFDPLDSIKVIIFFAQGRLLKISPYYPLDSGETLYSVFTFEKAEASILGGVGVPWLMRNEQDMLNSAIRMMMDNSALSVGPQIFLDSTKVSPVNGSWKFTPRKFWEMKGQELGSTNPPIIVQNIPSNQAQLQGIIDVAMRLIDEVVALPIIAQGEQGAHVTQTASGMAMLMDSANVVFREVIKNFDDDLTTPTIRRMYDWNMQFSPKDEIKGDMNTEATGVSVLLMKQIESEQLLYVVNTLSVHPIAGPAIMTYKALRLAMQRMSIDPDQILATPEEFEAKLKSIAESESQKQDPDVIRAQTSLQVAEIDSASRKMQAENQLEIAKLNQKTEVLKLIQRDDVDMAGIQALLAGKQLDADTKERMFAAEAAVEQQNAERAIAMGGEPSGSGGSLSFGVDKK